MDNIMAALVALGIMVGLPLIFLGFLAWLDYRERLVRWKIYSEKEIKSV